MPTCAAVQLVLDGVFDLVLDVVGHVVAVCDVSVRCIAICNGVMCAIRQLVVPQQFKARACVTFSHSAHLNKHIQA